MLHYLMDAEPLVFIHEDSIQQTGQAFLDILDVVFLIIIFHVSQIGFSPTWLSVLVWLSVAKVKNITE